MKDCNECVNYLMNSCPISPDPMCSAYRSITRACNMNMFHIDCFVSQEDKAMCDLYGCGDVDDGYTEFNDRYEDEDCLD